MSAAENGRTDAAPRNYGTAGPRWRMAETPTPGEGARRGTDPREAAGWIDPERYPFESRFMDLDPGRLHYVDEGEGRPLVMLHGNPTWSFVYRHLIAELSDDYRCIVPDYFGFGLSEKPRDWSYRVRDHARVVETVLEELGVTDATLFLQDWGGPIGANYAANHPENVDSFVVMNSAMWPMNDALHVRAFSGLMDTPIAGYLNRRYNVPVDWVMPSWFGDRSRLTPEIHRHYREPLADPDDRRGALTFTRELIGATPFLSELWERRRRVAGTPALICWGMEGPLFRTQALGRWEALFPDARTVEFPTAGHFVQEEQGDRTVAAVRRFLSERSGRP